MVGVPGRSTACHNCKQRKIKCGGETPSCHNCTKSRRQCLGYQREHTFIFSKNVDLVGSTSTSAGSSSSNAGQASSGGRRQATAGGGPSTAGPSGGPWRTGPHGAASARGAPRLFRPVSARHAFRKQLLSMYFTAILPQDMISFSHIRMTKSRYWLLHMVDLTDLSPALEAGVLAVCAARLGVRDGQPRLLHQSLIQYNQSLRPLQRDLCHPALRRHDHTLAACMALTVFEFSECPEGLVQGYLTHYKGAMELMQRRGPELHVSGLAHSILRTLRIHTAYRSLATRKPSFLASKEWLEVPWGDEGKDCDDEVVDILLNIPRILAQTDAAKLEERPLKKLAGILESVRLCWEADKALREWFDRFDSSIPGPLFWPELSTLQSAADTSRSGKLFPVAYRFHAYIIAQTLVYYWVSLMLVYQHLSRLYQALQLSAADSSRRLLVPCTCEGAAEIVGADASIKSTTCLRHFDVDKLPPLGLRRDWARTVAYEICRSVEYFLHPAARDVGPANIFPALRILRFLWKGLPGDWAREQAWLRDMIAIIQERGNHIARYAQTDDDVLARQNPFSDQALSPANSESSSGGSQADSSPSSSLSPPPSSDSGDADSR